jgi:hypothetical protein
VVWNKTFGGMNQDLARDVHCAQEYVYVTGRTMSNFMIDAFSIVNQGGGDALAGKFKTPMVLEDVSEGDVGLEVMAYPNPSAGRVRVRCADVMERVVVTDVLGHVVCDVSPGEGDYLMEFPVGGVYFLTVTAGENSSVLKIIVD